MDGDLLHSAPRRTLQSNYIHPRTAQVSPHLTPPAVSSYLRPGTRLLQTLADIPPLFCTSHLSTQTRACPPTQAVFLLFPSARAQRGTHKGTPNTSGRAGCHNWNWGPSWPRLVRIRVIPRGPAGSAAGRGEARGVAGGSLTAGQPSGEGQRRGGACSKPQPSPRPPAPLCPWPSAAMRITRLPTGWTRASSTTAASWTRSTWCRTSSCSSSPSPSSSSVRARAGNGGGEGRGTAPLSVPFDPATATRPPAWVTCSVYYPAVSCTRTPTHPLTPSGSPEPAANTADTLDPRDPPSFATSGPGWDGERGKQRFAYAPERSRGVGLGPQWCYVRSRVTPPPRRAPCQPQLGPRGVQPAPQRRGWRPCEPLCFLGAESNSGQ